MNTTQIKAEIKRISKIEDPNVCQDEIKKLNKKLGGVFIAQLSGNYYYFYKIKYKYSVEKKRSEKIIQKPPLGRMLKEEYEKNKDLIKELTVNELKKRIEPISE